MDIREDLDLDKGHFLKLNLEGGIWFRIACDEVSNKAQELKDVLYAYTRTPESGSKKEFENNLNTEFKGILERKYMYKTQCICTCSACVGLFDTYHIPTKQTLAVGSSCITKFIDIHFTAKARFYKRNGTCKMCGTFIVLKSTPDFKRNFKSNKKNCKSNENKICFACEKPHMQLRVNQVKTMLYLREILLEQKNEKVFLVEKESNLIALNIKYHEKEAYKKRYGIVWNHNLKLWFINKCKIRHETICNKLYIG
jgi:hypothetical protein